MRIKTSDWKCRKFGEKNPTKYCKEILWLVTVGKSKMQQSAMKTESNES